MRRCQLCLLVSLHGLRVRGASNGTLTPVARADNATSARRRLSVEYQELAKLVAADAAAGDHFGNSVAIDGSTVVIGAPYDTIMCCPFSGSAYVFRTSDGGATYVEVAKLTAADAAKLDQFGRSVAIDGDTIVVGAVGDNIHGGNGGFDNDGQGSAYVFRTSDNGATYDQVAKLTASDAAENDFFGYSVAIDGNTVVVGTWFGEAAYVFRTSDGGATYDQVAKLTATDAAAYKFFGQSVAIDGNTIMVGAYNQYDVGSGAVHVFRTSDGGATYVEVAKLTAADAAAGDCFSSSVAIDGSTVVVGAILAGTGGAVYVFRTSDGGATYGQVAKLTAADAARHDHFGTSVAIDGDTIVVGAYYYSNNDKGSAYVYRTSDGGDTYAQVAKLTASDAAEDDFFGGSVAIAGATVVVGAYNDGNPGNVYEGSGSAYVFGGPQPRTTPQPTPQPGPTPEPTPELTPRPTLAGAVSSASGSTDSSGGGDDHFAAAGGGLVAGAALLVLAAGALYYWRSRRGGADQDQTSRVGENEEVDGSTTAGSVVSSTAMPIELELARYDMSQAIGRAEASGPRNPVDLPPSDGGAYFALRRYRTETPDAMHLLEPEPSVAPRPVVSPPAPAPAPSPSPPLVSELV